MKCGQERQEIYGLNAGDATNPGGVMSSPLKEEIRECYEHAAEAHERAELATTAIERQDWLEAEQRWLFLARSYSLSERLFDCNSEADEKRGTVLASRDPPGAALATDHPGS